MRDAVEADKKAFALVAEGKCETPLRTKILAPEHDGCFLFMPAYAPELDAASLKAVNIFPKNAESGLPVCPAQVLLIDGKTGVITAVLDGTYVTEEFIDYVRPLIQGDYPCVMVGGIPRHLYMSSGRGKKGE